MSKELLYSDISKNAEEMAAMADFIFDHPELGLQEHQAFGLLTDWLEKAGFQVERGVAGVETAFKAVYHHGQGGPNIGLLCEYDALAGLGHACGHHMQGPAILMAAHALKSADIDKNYTITVYGTPAEETVSGKIMMINNGCTFEELDVAMMMHGSGATQVDVKSLALNKYTVIYHGTASHAAVKPERGRSALDGLILAFQGVEFLREHVLGDVKMHYTVVDCGGTEANIVPARAEGSFYIRSYSRTYLDKVAERFTKILKGAAMMTETEVEIIEEKAIDSKIPCIALNDIIMENAKAVDAPRLREPREKTGSTDFGNIMHRVPGSCIRVAFVAEESASHSQDYLDGGKSKEAHEAIVYGARILAGTAFDLIEKPELLAKVKAEFKSRLEDEKKM